KKKNNIRSQEDSIDDTKKFLSNINIGLKNKRIDKMIKDDITKYDINFNKKIEEIFPINKKLISFLNPKQNKMNFYSSTDSLFGDKSATILLIETTFPLTSLNIILKNSLVNLILTVVLLVFILFIFAYIIKKEITNKLQTITEKIKNNEKIENEIHFIKEIGILKNSYNEMLEKLNNQIEVNKELSYIDSLTQLRNRKAYDEKIDETLSLYKRYKSVFSIAILDIDDFKNVNDTYGHSTGDIVLKDIAKTLKASTRDGDTLFRIGGEEFVVIFPLTSLSDAKIVAEKIRKNVDTELSVNNINITLSIGLSEIGVGDCKDSIFKRIDKFLYISKKTGKNKVTAG
ncbi:MAG: diguanylate cyclase (GGDEF)-like protein, partial [Sulfurimonas sp.]